MQMLKYVSCSLNAIWRESSISAPSIMTVIVRKALKSAPSLAIWR
ncbi:Uncharacterised protein [Aquipseudomonas alcaligenes]|uniref:Uncharacterized protein n=1 Tax=Aquipseudomonas alcaligenes TaxID=43263 RepID=A0A1N6NR12_AQUAC|nr:hypothetical protein SAMN05878282_101482 [Pseudomonas alcaligenes]SUD13217.1 Uncharacterised protein [Pseudomonas alcaligenes]